MTDEDRMGLPIYPGEGSGEAKLRPKMRLRNNLRIVVHQIRSMDNLGAVARLMANFGFTDLWLSDPHTHAFQEAEKMAVKAGHLLSTMQVATSLSQALGEAVYAV